ncbi:signal peptidase II [Alteribacter natronophilus]|uniref:signal peptidase II n=1 Tax=Alteribacter natronophilus TaxID=2583810 RepID=UPI00110E0B6A|nr:signal peptidase II [Alteribacter natronophilus]TMW74059.1 lipoprotein signal peptidase [Alteribacter natronophilus]
MMYYAIALIIIVLDQITKWIVVQRMEQGESIPIIENVFHLTSHRNAGAAFGILQGQMWLFYIATAIVLVFVTYYIQTQGKYNPLFGTSLGLVLGGAIGNFIDRLLFNEVVDFIDVYIGTYNFPIFNVADMALTIGVGMLIVYVFIEDRKQEKKND